MINISKLENLKDIVVVGGCGFIGSHLVDFLINNTTNPSITIIDNLSSGKVEFVSKHFENKRVKFINYDIGLDLEFINLIPESCGIFHLASNPNISAAATSPSIDFFQGTVITNSVLEAARIKSCSFFVYTSGSGVYGERGLEVLQESDACLFPISTYAASKIAGESLLSAYSKMYGLNVYVFRFGNVVGRRQTHGISYDLVRQLKHFPKTLHVLGNGLQSKTYVHVDDVLSGIFTVLAKDSSPFSIYNVGSDSYVTVREISEIITEFYNAKYGLKVDIQYQDHDRGWNGDIPVMRMSNSKLKSLGWEPNYTSVDAIKSGIEWLFNFNY